VIGTIDPQSKRGTFRFHVNPLVMWIWLGGMGLVVGASLSLWPDLAFGELGAGNIVPPYTPLLYEININTIVN